jgi:hypothetical protein
VKKHCSHMKYPRWRAGSCQLESRFVPGEWMRLPVIAIVASACWRGNEPPPAEPAPRPALTSRSAELPLPCDAFDDANPSCRDTCLPGAPDDWPGCVIARDKLIAQGYTCATPSVRSCAPPPPPPRCVNCPPVTARIVGTQIAGATIRIIIGAGSDHGVTRTWKADIVDRPSGTPVAGGNVAIVRIDRAVTVGTVTLTIQQVQATPYVFLQP